MPPIVEMIHIPDKKHFGHTRFGGFNL